LYPDVPVIIGGIEASLRRLSHYDYWQDKLVPSILFNSKADLLIYGMGEKPIISIARLLSAEDKQIDTTIFKNLILRIPQHQTAILLNKKVFQV
jgi:radical SAM superfamily enzyme YgiQ (UPF0313 family)